MTTTLESTVDPRIVLDGPSRALLDTVMSDAETLPGIIVRAPGGYGKSVLLRQLARAYRRAGLTVVENWPQQAPSIDAKTVLLVDDAHRLDERQLADLCHLVRTRQARLVLAHRPWPRPAALMEVGELLNRDGRTVLLRPFTAQQTGAYLAANGGPSDHSALVDFIQAQTCGVPRDVARLARALRHRVGPAQSASPPLEIPESVLSYFGPELAGLHPDVGRVLLAAVTGVPLYADLLSALLGCGPAEVDELLAAARATGLLSADDQLSPLVSRAVAAFSPATQRAAVWRRLTELQLARNAPVLPMIQALRTAGANDDWPVRVYVAAAEEALPEDPGLAAELFARSAAAGGSATGRQALAAALSGDLDTALRLADQLLATPAAERSGAGQPDSAGPDEHADPAVVAAAALAHRGQLGRSAELYRWSGTGPAAALAEIGFLGTGVAEAPGRPCPEPPVSRPPTLLSSAATLMAEGVRESISGTPTGALSALVQAATLLEPAGRTVLLPDSPNALAALIALHCGELDIGEQVLHRAVTGQLGGALLARRHRLLTAWILMMRGRTGAAAELLAATVSGGGPLETRDLLFATALEVGIARRNSDLPALQRGWAQALAALVRHPVDLFMLLPLGELAITAARLGEWSRLSPYLVQAHRLLDRLGGAPLWATPLHWSALHAAILAKEPAVADEQLAALTSAAGHSRYATVIAAAAESWVSVLRGVVDATQVESAARGLHQMGLCWDAASLAGQAAIRTSDRRSMTLLLECARSFQPRSTEAPAGVPAARAGDGPVPQPGGTVGEDRLSDREQQVARLVLAGLTYKQIGDRLFISAKTVEHHMARMRSRLNCANRSELLVRLRAILADQPTTAP